MKLRIIVGIAAFMSFNATAWFGLYLSAVPFERGTDMCFTYIAGIVLGGLLALTVATEVEL